MSADYIVEIYVGPLTAKSRAAVDLQRFQIEKAVEKTAQSPSSYHGHTWVHEDGAPPSIGGSFQFARTLSAPGDLDARRIMRDVDRAIRRVVGRGPYISVRVLNSGKADWLAQETSARRTRA